MPLLDIASPPSHRHLPVYEQISTERNGSLDTHATYWWQTSGRFLAALLEDAGYIRTAQHKILMFFSATITPFMGPARTTRDDSPQWRSFMTDDHHPIELSWDFGTGGKAPTIRFSIEPLGIDAGTSSDPHNEHARSDFLEVLIRELPDMDLETFRHFEHELISRNPVDVNVLQEIQGHPSTIFFGFDLIRDKIRTKAYFFPGLKAKEEDRTNLQVVASVIATAPGCSPGQLNALRTFEDFVREHDAATPEFSLEIDMLAIDLVPPTESRVKIYFRTRDTSFASVRQMMTLGQRLPRVEFGKLHRFWDALLDQAGAPDDQPLSGADVSHRTAGLIYNVEIRSGSVHPKVKIYIPVRHYARSDEAVLSAVHEYMSSVRAYGDRKKDTLGYAHTMQSLFKPAAMQQQGLHAYIGCSVDDNGELRVVPYFNCEVDKMTGW
ncbi:hypothetical protein BDW74DRAFT_179754 [Aspergillus multicolor]|uniref:uncharacterized protein n=1 Tax=Aspergillus multicolor TaxID=41759 RepID=UPI003CCCFFEA